MNNGTPKRQRKDGWSEADRQYLRDHFETATNEELASALNRSPVSIQTMASKELGLKRSSAALSQRLIQTWKSREGTWSEAEKQYLIDNWQTKTRKEMAKALGRSPAAIKSMGQKEMGLKKTPDAVQAVMKRNRNATQFQKGAMPHNTIYGDELTVRIRKNKDKEAYKWIRTSFRKWKQYHLYLWEKANGPVPEGHMIVFRNGDQMDCRLDNLELISREDHARRHSPALNLTDGFVINTIAPRDPDLKAELRKYPELINLKRTQLQLNRAINHEQIP